MNSDLFNRFQTALPRVQEWIDCLVHDHAPQARAVSSFGFKRLSACYPAHLLARSKVVLVPHVPFPPVSRLGLPEFAAQEQRSFAGITFLDTIFLQQENVSESTCFHEMIHVVQWNRLGADNFLLAYGVLLAQFGYEDSPLEQMAYSLQADFEKGAPLPSLVAIIEEQTYEVWTGVVPLLENAIGA